MKHKDKLKLARRMMTQEEIENNIPPFESKAWNGRKTFNELKQRTQKLNKESK